MFIPFGLNLILCISSFFLKICLHFGSPFSYLFIYSKVVFFSLSFFFSASLLKVSLKIVEMDTLTHCLLLLQRRWWQYLGLGRNQSGQFYWARGHLISVCFTEMYMSGTIQILTHVSIPAKATWSAIILQKSIPAELHTQLYVDLAISIIRPSEYNVCFRLGRDIGLLGKVPPDSIPLTNCSFHASLTLHSVWNHYPKKAPNCIENMLLKEKNTAAVSYRWKSEGVGGFWAMPPLQPRKKNHQPLFKSDFFFFFWGGGQAPGPPPPPPPPHQEKYHVFIYNQNNWGGALGPPPPRKKCPQPLFKAKLGLIHWWGSRPLPLKNSWECPCKCTMNNWFKALKTVIVQFIYMFNIMLNLILENILFTSHQTSLQIRHFIF